MTRAALLTTCMFVALSLGGCGGSQPPATAAAQPAPVEAPAAVTAPEPDHALVMPDACTILDASEVAKVAGWKSAKPVKVNTGAEYLAACDFLDSADPKHAIRVGIAFGALIPDDSANYASIVGDREGTLVKPAIPVTNLGVPAIEMDGGPGAQSMQTRFEPTTELTVTTPAMQMTRMLFPRALIKLRSLPELQEPPRP